MTSLKNNFQCTNQLSSGFYFDLVGGGLNLNFSSKVYLLGYLNYCNLENAPKYSHFFFYYFHSLVITQPVSSSSSLCINLTAFWSAMENRCSFSSQTAPMSRSSLVYIQLSAFLVRQEIIKMENHALSFSPSDFPSPPSLYHRPPCSSRDLGTNGYFRDKSKSQERISFLSLLLS